MILHSLLNKRVVLINACCMIVPENAYKIVNWRNKCHNVSLDNCIFCHKVGVCILQTALSYGEVYQRCDPVSIQLNQLIKGVTFTWSGVASVMTSICHIRYSSTYLTTANPTCGLSLGIVLFNIHILIQWYQPYGHVVSYISDISAVLL